MSQTDYHYNATWTYTPTIVTPGAGSIDSREVGVRPNGTYWGAAGEQIDVRSGNVNFTEPLISAKARGGWGVGFNLTYNSQNWLWDNISWNLAADVGYGYGWKLLAGSITPIYSNYWVVSYYLLADATGAEYRLDQNNNNVWTSSTDGIHIWYDANANYVRFPDGSFWVMDCVSGGTEQDAGTYYPTLIEDSNGNQISIAYATGQNAEFSNSSARISLIADVRGNAYSFTYNSDSPVPHLTGIVNYIGTSENYSFSVTEGGQNPQLVSPFDSSSFGAVTMLQSVTQTGTNMVTSFTYTPAGGGSSGELASITMPYNGKLTYAYGTNPYPGNRGRRELQSRGLVMQANGPTYTYTFTYDSPTPGTVHAWATITDAGGQGQKNWTFNTSGPFVGLVSGYNQWSNSVSKSLTTYGWTTDPGGRPYVATLLTTLDPGQSYSVSKQTTQTMDANGNITQQQFYNWGAPGSGSPGPLARTYTNTYSYTQNGYPGPQHAARYIFNRLWSSVVSDGTYGATLVQNYYDLNLASDVPGITSHDSAYAYPFNYRGNVSTSITPTATSNFYYDIGGNVVTSNTNGVTTTSNINSSTQWAAPSQITTNSLSSNMNWTDFLGLSQASGPNGDSASIQYDSNVRPSSSTSPYGAVTTYGYNVSPPYTVATTNGHYVTTSFDGFGRAIRVDKGYMNGNNGIAVSSVITNYAPCGCSPLGKVSQVSQPFAPGGTEYLTTYTYDGLGRTMSVSLPDGSATTYNYAGNQFSVTDASGHWKVYNVDVFGNLTVVTEPDPQLGNVLTFYTYDILNHLTQVSMSRNGYTQTRTFNYNSGNTVTGLLQSASNPENGTVSYSYNSNNLLASKTDAKGQTIIYSYDGYNRLFQVSSGGSSLRT